MATPTFRGVLLGVLLFFAASSTGSLAAARPGPATSPEPAPGVAREEYPVFTTPPPPPPGSLSRRPHRAPPPLEEVVVFEDSLEGHPLDDEGGWTHQDVSAKPTAWHIDSLQTCQGKAWWCGLVDSSWVNDSNRRGYGNSWTHYLENSVRLDTIPAGTTARIGFRYYFNAEPNYDYGFVEVLDLNSSWVGIAAFTGKSNNSGLCDTFSVAIPEQYRLPYYADPDNPLPLHFRFVFISDVSFSSQDGLYDGDGWVIDNITVKAGNQVRFFDNCENGMGNWIRTQLPAVGDFYALANNVPTEDVCTDNRTNVWVDWDPVLHSLVPRLDNLLNTPAVAVQRSDRVVVNFDVYRNLPLEACFYYHLNYRWRNAGQPWSDWTDPTRLLYYGATKDWARQKVVLANAAGKDSVQVQLAITDFGPIYCDGTQNANGVYTFFDNVAIGITATAPPILVQRDLDLYQDTFQTTSFFKDDNINSPVGDSTVVQVSTPRGYKSGFLNYRVNGGSFQSRTLVVGTPALPNLRSADVLPGNYPANSLIEYYFAVTDSQDVTSTLPAGALDDHTYFSVSVLPLKTATNPTLSCFDSLASILFVNNFAGREPSPYFADAMKAMGYKFDTWDVNAPTTLAGNTPGGSDPGGPYYWPPTSVNSLLQYKAIIWHSGNMSAHPLRPLDQGWMQSWIQQPGKDRNLWISGDDICTALTFGDEYNGFLSFTCGTKYLRDLWENFPQDSLHPVVVGVAGSPSAGRSMHANAGCPLIDDFDLITNSPGAVTSGKVGAYLRYPNTWPAAMRYATKYTGFGSDSSRVIFQGFSFNDIEEGGERLQLVQATLQNYFKVSPCYYASAVETPPGGEEAPAFANRLFQNAPNPFNPETAIRYTVATTGKVTIRIFNAAGALVRTLVDEPHGPGAYTKRWDGTDDSGRRLGSGVYFYEIQMAGGYREARKLVMLK